MGAASVACRSPRGIAPALRRSNASCARASDAGVGDLTVFSFSTENWSPPEPEVTDLLGLFSELIDRETHELNAENVRMRFIGRLDALPPELQAADRAGRRSAPPATPASTCSSR